MGGGGDVNVHCIASSEDVATLQMLLRWRCCYVQDVVTLKMLLRWRCCYVEDVVTLKMLLPWRCCCVEDVVTLKMLLPWRCCCVEDVVTLKMLLRWRCCYLEDVVALKMLLGWRCCCVEDVVRLKMLLHWRCCYVEDAVALKMMLRWKCCYVEDVVTNAFKTALWMWRKKSLMWIFAHDSLGSMTFLCQSKETWNSKKHAIAMESTKIIYNEELKKDKTHSNSGTYPRYVVRMLNWFLVLSSHGKKTQRCKTQWAMTFFKVDNNELQLPSGEPQASTLYI